MSIVINTPNGNIGRSLALALLDAGEAITVISRDAQRVEALVERGASVVEGSLDDEATLKAAFEGATALFWLSPPIMAPDFIEQGRRNAERAARLAAQAGIERVVVLSSAGAQSGAGVGPVSALGPIEQAFREQIAHVTVLRAGFFMENYLRDLGTIASMGKVFGPVDADRPMPMVSTSDIAGRAAEVLRDRSWDGHRTLGVHGPRDLSFAAAAKQIGEALGRPVEYVQVSFEQARAGMLQAGLPEFGADVYLEMYQAMNDGRMDPAEPRDAASTTPTEIGQFARTVLAPALEATSAA